MKFGHPSDPTASTTSTAVYDEIFDAVISQGNDDDVSVRISPPCCQFENEITELRGTICQLQAKVDFFCYLLSALPNQEIFQSTRQVRCPRHW